MTSPNIEFNSSSSIFNKTCAFKLAEKFGTPLFVYHENTLREQCRLMRNLLTYPHFSVNYSAKANSNPELLKIIREEGLNADAMSSGEIFLERAAGFNPNQIFYISNNATEAELLYALDQGILISVDSLDQLELVGKLCPGCRIAMRINTGIGAGHHAKVITCGTGSKFGISPEDIPSAQIILKRYNLQMVGLNHHIGSLFHDQEPYLNAAARLLDLATLFPELLFVDFGGGFGIPVNNDETTSELDLNYLGQKLDALLSDWTNSNRREILAVIEPGRFITAQCGILLGKITSIKKNPAQTYIGTDLGFNNFPRTVLYDSYHDMEIYSHRKNGSIELADATLTGNICESGDLLTPSIKMQLPETGDLIAVQDAGAYGYSMSSNYNGRLRPAEVLICADGSIKLIRQRDTLESLLQNCTNL